MHNICGRYRRCCRGETIALLAYTSTIETWAASRTRAEWGSLTMKIVGINYGVTII